MLKWEEQVLTENKSGVNQKEGRCIKQARTMNGCRLETTHTFRIEWLTEACLCFLCLALSYLFIYIIY